MNNTEDLSFVADALLALIGPDEAKPYNFDTIAKKPAYSKRRFDAFVQLAMSRRPGDELLENECEEIFERAMLTPRQAEVLDLRLLGLSFDQIGKCKGGTRQGAMASFLQAIKKIGRVMRVYPYTGLSDVYRYEVRRGVRHGTFGRMRGYGASGPR